MTLKFRRNAAPNVPAELLSDKGPVLARERDINVRPSATVPTSILSMNAKRG